jgi:methylenetetrahydrofolate dehydrogenase (NADP+)/methenyltetrahydrofolate cyclohydrolase
MSEILSGIAARDALVDSMKQEVQTFERAPTLVIIQVGDRPDSTSYINQKKRFAERIGAKVIHRQFPEVVTQQELINVIEKDNADKSIDGIILQIPLPPHLDKNFLINTIDPEKDVDGLTVATKMVPATARGVLALCAFYEISLEGKKVTVIGKSALVGTPIALSMKAQGAEVTVCDKKTGDLIPYTKSADIIVVAAGHPRLIGKEHVSAYQVVIDVGINVSGDKKLTGDVYFEEVELIVAAITPVPGGVGPMTVTALFQNLLDAYKNRAKAV